MESAHSFTNKNQHWNKRDVVSIQAANHYHRRRRSRQKTGWILKAAGRGAMASIWRHHRHLYENRSRPKSIVFIFFFFSFFFFSLSGHVQSPPLPPFPPLQPLLLLSLGGQRVTSCWIITPHLNGRRVEGGSALLPVGWRGLTMEHREEYNKKKNETIKNEEWSNPLDRCNVDYTHQLQHSSSIHICGLSYLFYFTSSPDGYTHRKQWGKYR